MGHVVVKVGGDEEMDIGAKPYEGNGCGVRSLSVPFVLLNVPRASILRLLGPKWHG